MNESLLEIAEWLRRNPQEAGGDLYHPLPFPEFDSLRTSSRAPASARKWHLIERSLHSSALTGASALDVGANAGFFSFSLAKLGARVDAYEPHAHYVSLGERIANATSLDVTFIGRPLVPDDLRGKHYDVALMLSVFQWISEGNRRLAHAVDVLRAVSTCTNTLYFELGCNAGKSAIQVKGNSLVWTYSLLKEFAAPKRVYYLGSATAWGRARRHMFVVTDRDVRLTARQRVISFLLERATPRVRILP
jgi:SAM-dependent methyltransferase